MQILNFPKINFTYNLYSKNTLEDTNKGSNSTPYKNTAGVIFSYPPQYYLSFKGKTLDLRGQLERLDPKQLPSVKILDQAAKALSNPKNKKTLYHIHQEVFSPLKDCKTLEEAKALFPEEFKDVIDAKDLVITYDMRTIKKIAAGQIEGLTLDNLSLTFIKKFFAEVAGISDKNKWFGLSSQAILNIAKNLKIDKPNAQYVQLYKSANPSAKKSMRKAAKNYQKGNKKAKEAQSKRMKEYFENPDNKKRHKEAIAEYWADPDHKNDQSERITEYYEKHPERKEEQAEFMREVFDKDPERKQAFIKAGQEASHTDDANKKRAQSLQKHYEDPNERNKRKEEQLDFHALHPERGELLSKAWHKDETIISTMQEVAKEFPHIGRILNKLKHTKLTEEEEIYRKAYLARCNEVCPNFQKSVGETYTKMLQEFEENN